MVAPHFVWGYFKEIYINLLQNVQNYVIIKCRKEAEIMPQIRPITDLRNTNEISEICHAKNEPLFITKNGYGHLVVMSMETYEELIEASRTDVAIREAEGEMAEGGELLDAKEALTALRRKHFG